MRESLNQERSTDQEFISENSNSGKQEAGKKIHIDYGDLNPQEVERFETLRAYFQNHLDAGKSKDPQTIKMVEEYRILVGRFLTSKPKQSKELIN